MKKIVNNIPNMITISRIISCIIGGTLFTIGNIGSAIAFYIYGAVSDAFDGFLARKLNAVTELGKKLDPISDKIFALSLMTPTIILGNYFMALPLIFEGIISSINIYSEIKYKNVHTEKVGKIKTIMLFPMMILGLLSTVEPYLYAIFIPIWYATLKLQVKSVESYLEQLNNNTDNYNIENENENNKITNNCNKLNKTYKNIDNEIIKKKSKENIKKLVRKKEEQNDRY